MFRFSADSLRGAYDAGWSSAQIFEWLSRHSTTGIPQPLAYLVDDVARRHGSVRIGTATSYVQTRRSGRRGRSAATPVGGRRTGCGNWRLACSQRPLNRRSCSSSSRNWAIGRRSKRIAAGQGRCRRSCGPGRRSLGRPLVLTIGERRAAERSSGRQKRPALRLASWRRPPARRGPVHVAYVIVRRQSR